MAACGHVLSFQSTAMHNSVRACLHCFDLGCSQAPGVQAHVAQGHPACEFCATRFFDSDALYKHMNTAHCSCLVCRRAAGNFRYFRTPDGLRTHMNAEHHACPDPMCQQACVGFAFAEELRAHHVSEHTNRMPRMDRSRAYRLQIEPPAPVSMQASGHASGRGARRQQRGTNAVQDDGRSAAMQPATDATARASTGRQGLLQHSGLVMIDDSEGTALGGQDHEVPVSNWPGAPGQRQQTAEPAFPLLSDSVSSSAAQADAPAARLPPLVRRQVACPCGRNKKAVVVHEGTEPGSLACTAQCAAAQRQRQLADAFGRDVDDADSMLPTREVEWPADLIVVRPAVCTFPRDESTAVQSECRIWSASVCKACFRACCMP